jgi:hypothetical protein
MFVAIFCWLNPLIIDDQHFKGSATSQNWEKNKIATLTYTLYILAALQKRFLQILFAFLGFSEGLDHFLEKVGQMYAFCGGRETHVLKNGELLKKE